MLSFGDGYVFVLHSPFDFGACLFLTLFSWIYVQISTAWSAH